MENDIDRCIDRLVTKLFSQRGYTPLHEAVDGGHSEVVKQLLLSQANVDIENNVSSAHLLCQHNYVRFDTHVRVELDESPDWLVDQWVGGCGQWEWCLSLKQSV